MTTTPVTVLPADIVEYIQACQKKEHQQSYLISVLQKLQQHAGYLTAEQLDAVSQLMQIPAAKVTGVATFYHFFKFQPPGKHKITVCMGTACYVRGAAKVLERLKESLKIKEGETTPDRLFSIECARCLGACALAPVVVVDEKVFGNVKPGEVRKILADYQKTAGA